MPVVIAAAYCFSSTYSISTCRVSISLPALFPGNSLCFNCCSQVRPSRRPLPSPRGRCCRMSLISDPDSFQVGRLIGSYGFLNITTTTTTSYSGLQSGMIDTPEEIAEPGRFKVQDVGQGNVNIRLYEGRIAQGPSRGTPVIFKVYPGQQVGGMEADMMAANELNAHAFLQRNQQAICQNIQILLGGFETKTGEQWLAFRNDGIYSAADYAKVTSEKMSKTPDRGDQKVWNPFEKDQTLKRRRYFVTKLLQGTMRGLSYMHDCDRLHQSLGPYSVVLNTMAEKEAAFLVPRLRDLAFSVDISYPNLKDDSGTLSEGLWRRASVAGAFTPLEKSAFGFSPSSENLIRFSAHFTLLNCTLLPMNCLQNLPRSSALPLQSFVGHSAKSSCSVKVATVLTAPRLRQNIVAKAISGSTSSTEMDGAIMEEEKSDVYSNNMTEAMGAVLTYRHELGMNYNFIRPDLIVGSCLQSPEDVDKLRKIGVKTIFCLQQDPDLEYFGVDIKAIREYASSCGDIQHLRAQIRDFDGFDLRIQLPAVVSKLHKAINSNGGVTYIHCTAGLGRAPTVALAYMFWIQGYKLSEAHELLMSKRSCFPNRDAIKSATADILTGIKKKTVTLRWNGSNCSTVEISGLDIGWGQRIPLNFDKKEGSWILRRELPEGHYEYKYIVDSEWMCNKYELVTSPNKDGHVNNYIKVSDSNPNSMSSKIRKRLTGEEDPDLTKNERIIIRQFLEACPVEE